MQLRNRSTSRHTLCCELERAVLQEEGRPVIRFPFRTGLSLGPVAEQRAEALLCALRGASERGRNVLRDLGCQREQPPL